MQCPVSENKQSCLNDLSGREAAERECEGLAVSGKSADERRSWKADGLRRRTVADASRTGVRSRTRWRHRALFTKVAALNRRGSLPMSRCRIPPLASMPGSKASLHPDYDNGSDCDCWLISKPRQRARNLVLPRA